MAFHVNPETGVPGKCRAKMNACPFAATDEHFENTEDAAASYETFASNVQDSKSSAYFNFTILEQDAFINGDCGHLALALQKKTGYPLVAIAHDNFQFEHLAVELPDGRILDVEGIHTKEDFAKAWDVKPAEIRQQVDLMDFKYGIIGLQNAISPVKTANKILKVVSPLLDEAFKKLDKASDSYHAIPFRELFSKDSFNAEKYQESSKAFLENLSVSEKESLTHYVQSGYYEINKSLYGDLKTKEITRLKLAIDSALKNAPEAPTELWRSINGDSPHAKSIVSNIKLDSVLALAGYTSTSETPDALTGLYGDSDYYMNEVDADLWETEEGSSFKVAVPEEYTHGPARNIVFKIKTSKAAPVSTLRGRTAEQEWLIPRGKRFIVTQIHRNVSLGELDGFNSKVRAQVIELEEA